jgi:hypothetical protein
MRRGDFQARSLRIEIPVFILLDLPEPLVPRLHSRDYQIADARQILGATRFWPGGDAAMPIASKLAATATAITRPRIRTFFPRLMRAPVAWKAACLA